MEAGGIKGRIAQRFSHNHGRQTYGFIVLCHIQALRESAHIDGVYRVPVTDPVLHLPVYKVPPHEQTIRRLPTVSDEILHLIPAPYEPDWQEEDVQYRLECDWDVACLCEETGNNFRSNGV